MKTSIVTLATVFFFLIITSVKLDKNIEQQEHNPVTTYCNFCETITEDCTTECEFNKLEIKLFGNDIEEEETLNLDDIIIDEDEEDIEFYY